MGQALTITHTATDYNGYNISCFGKVDGAIDITITGGTAPYSTQWTHGPTTPDVANLPAGYYAVVVMDADSTLIRYEVTLTEPMLLEGHLDPFRYPGGYNISCYDCYNGSIDLEVFGGVAPYNYEWYDDATTQDRTALGTGNYGLLLTDANGCVFKSDEIYLAQPERDDWSRSGNAGTDPATQYIGTSDNKDVVFKSNGAERLRLKSNGDIALPTMSGIGLLHRGADGVLHVGDPFLYGVPSDYWTTRGNFLTAAPDQFLGTRDNHALVVKTNNVERMRLTTTGRLGIGTNEPQQQLEVVHSDESGGINIRNARNDANAHSEIRFYKEEEQHWGLGCDLLKNGSRDFFLWDEVALSARLRVDADGRVLIGDATPQNSPLYKLYVEGGVVCRDVKVTAQAFPDYVFTKDYALMPLAEMQRYLHTHGHMPHFPSAAEVEQAGGVEVGDLQLRLLRTLEEQALYILELKAEMEALQTRMRDMESQQR